MLIIPDENEFLERLVAILRPAHVPKPTIKDEEAQPEWLLLEEAKKVLPYKSKKKWKELRNSHAIEFSSHGRQFLYNRQSLLQYIVSKSTMRATLNKQTNSKTHSIIKTNKHHEK